MKYDPVIYGMSAERERLLGRVMGSCNRWGKYPRLLRNFHLYRKASEQLKESAKWVLISFGLLPGPVNDLQDEDLNGDFLVRRTSEGGRG